MKLFQRLLVAPAALGLMAPVAVNADTAFNSTTTLSGEAVFTVGNMDGPNIVDVNGNPTEETYMQYAYTLDIDSSFSGSDILHVGIEAGNASAPLGDFLDSSVDSGADLTVSSLYYSFPVGDISITGGPLLLNNDIIAATTSSYSERLVAESLPFSAFEWDAAPGIAVEYATDSGFVASASFVSLDGADSSTGLNSDLGDDITTLSLGYNDESGFGGGIVYANSDGESAADIVGEYTTFGAGIYYNLEDTPLGISVTYDSIENEDLNTDSDSLFFGADYEVGPGTLMFAYQAIEIAGQDGDGFELGYSYDVNDNVNVTPAYFQVEQNDDKDTGVVVEGRFSF